MSQLRKLATAGGTFAVALGIGFVMQNGDALAARMGGGSAVTPSGPTQVTQSATPAASMPAVTLPAVPAAFTGTRGAPMPLAAATALVSPPLAALVAAAMAPQHRFQSTQLAQGGHTPSASVAVSIPDAVALPTRPEAPVALAAVDIDDLLDVIPKLEDVAAASSAAPDCTVSLDGVPGPAATVTLALSAPCLPDTATTIHHQGMIFSVETGPDGTVTFTVPALAEASVFIADINGTDGAVAVVTVPDFAMFDRAVLQWQGETGLQLHALEFGAGYADQGHLWNASLSSADAALAGEGGFMMRLGDPSLSSGHVAEVYSYPSQMSLRDGQINLSVEIEVTAANCGTEIAAQSIQIHPGAEPSALDLTMTLPGCEAIGEFLLLNNMLEDLTLIAR